MIPIAAVLLEVKSLNCKPILMFAKVSTCLAYLYINTYLYTLKSFAINKKSVIFNFNESKIKLTWDKRKIT